MKKIRKGDKVLIITGKDKGKRGLVKKINGDKIIVDGINLIKKHVKPNPQLGNPGGIIESEAMIHISNAALVDEQTGKKAKIKFVFENGKKSRKIQAAQ